MNDVLSRSPPPPATTKQLFRFKMLVLLDQTNNLLKCAPCCIH